MKKSKIVLILLFVFPLLMYFIFSSATHNSLFLPIISTNHNELPVDLKPESTKDSVQLKGKITILCFSGTNIDNIKGDLFNLNQKIYNKYNGFNDFQVVLVAPNGTEKEINTVLNAFQNLTKDTNNWNVVYGTTSAIASFYNSFNFKTPLNQDFGTSQIFILDKEIALRGRKGKNKKGEVEYRESYNMISAADLHNEMTDDVKILLREYRLALKKNKNSRTKRLYIDEK